MNQEKKSKRSFQSRQPAAAHRQEEAPVPSDKAGFDVRATASKILAAAVDRKIPLDGMLDLVHGNAAYKQLSDADRALARAILNSALRHLPRLEAAIGSMLDSPLPEGARALHHVLIVAAAQILHLDVPAHAVVDIAVEQAHRDPRNRRFAKLVNAVLRRLVRERQDVLDRTATVSPVPDWFMSRLSSAYGKNEAQRIAEAQLIPPAIDITVKSDPDSWAEKFGGRVLPTGSIRLPVFQGSVVSLPGYQEGEWWVQDVAASIPAKLFGDIKGWRIADLCAAPGGKTAQLAAAGATVIAVEQSANRLVRLKENLARLALDAELVQGDLFEFRPEELLDGVLLDAPCSSTGTTRRHPDVLWTKGPEDIAKLAALQAKMLRHAVTLVRPGGLIVFSNCSLDPLEGEDLVADLLRDDPSLERVPVDPAQWPGLEEAISPVGEFRTTPAMLPATDGFTGGMDGFFASVLRRR
ncbi:RsmB/NOP family class I SAM-dependent RNA methyltransferase [Pseudorhizobium pelagicum]|uniref:MFS transporter n=1 Tax=Pseudorhizobium pelagicum TaxID=1509405 RepID=A0A922NWX8_9HYPH|nr:RsmB/NOP family class I SAM-dependent RNA methyltransferase [Pseudorhizobium pelagicum]KEQ03355.1 MFS transporter [Pseudorhizobium pelagicum]KEQ05144.1 MFS transporter [Pseudorhizobium pelagicum]